MIRNNFKLAARNLMKDKFGLKQEISPGGLHGNAEIRVKNCVTIPVIPGI